MNSLPSSLSENEVIDTVLDDQLWINKVLPRCDFKNNVAPLTFASDVETIPGSQRGRARIRN
jgi:hypothetical protein